MGKTREDNQQQLLAFLIEKHGGEEAVYREFYGRQLGAMAAKGFTLGELRETAKEQGWLATLDGMKLTSIANIINPGPESLNAAASRGAGRRLTKAEIEKIRDDVVAYLDQNPWKSRNEIAEAIGVDSKKLRARIKALKDDGTLKSVGEKAGMKYALASEKSRP